MLCSKHNMFSLILREGKRVPFVVWSVRKALILKTDIANVSYIYIRSFHDMHWDLQRYFLGMYFSTLYFVENGL